MMGMIEAPIQDYVVNLYMPSRCIQYQLTHTHIHTHTHTVEVGEVGVLGTIDALGKEVRHSVVHNL